MASTCNDLLLIGFRYKALDASGDLEYLGDVQWEILGCLAAIEVLCFLCIFKGVKLTGKVNEIYTCML